MKWLSVVTDPHRGRHCLDNGHAPIYMADNCCLVAYACPRRLRLVNTRMLLISRMRTNFCKQAFNAAGPRVWNYVPTDLKQPDLLYNHFKLSLKTFLFGQ